jgi:ATP-dependent RNA helicase RhlE
MPFASLKLSPALLQAIGLTGYSQPTAVQVQAIPAILQGHDVLALAPTGSGKTAAFCFPILQKLQDLPQPKAPLGASNAAKHPPIGLETPQNDAPDRGLGPRARRSVRALVLAPTRELAAQTGAVLLAAAQHLPVAVKTSVVFGGVSINPQMLGLRGGADVLVATPGRLLDLLGHNAVDLSRVETLVLDEADRLLDLGFADELARLLAVLPAKRQNLFFSATFPPAVQTLADALLHLPVRIEVAATLQSKPDILQRAIEVDTSRRTQLLRHLIQQNKWGRVLVFVATKFATEIVADKLRKANINAEPFHGVLSQGKRTQVLNDFKASRVQVVVATDLAARGIDIADLPVVVNYDLPRSSVDYIHRIGRTGRAGESGLALSFITADSAAHFRLIEKRQSLSLPREQIAGFEPLVDNSVEESAASGAAPVYVDTTGTGGIKGKRPSKKDKLRAAASAGLVAAKLPPIAA